VERWLIRFLGGMAVGALCAAVSGLDPRVGLLFGGPVWLISAAGSDYGLRRARRQLPRHQPAIEGSVIFYSAAHSVVWSVLAVYGLVAHDFGLMRAAVAVAVLSFGCTYWYRKRLRDQE
jgi:hypothetical protein